jgi:hypothetical protein
MKAGIGLQIALFFLHNGSGIIGSALFRIFVTFRQNVVISYDTGFFPAGEDNGKIFREK